MAERCGTCGGEWRCIQGFGREKREKDHLEDQLIDGSMILKCIFSKWDVGAWTGSVWLRMGTGVGLL